MRITITSGPRRKKPQAGDEKIVKGVTMIRQQRRASCGAFIYSSGRPCFEWVEKGGEYDRISRGGF